MVRPGPKSFGSFSFPADVQSFSSNFANAVPRTRRLPGLTGGWSDDGTRPAMQAIGNVSVSFRLRVYDRADMDAARDAVYAMYNYGLQKLVMQPTDLADDERFCYARVNNIRMSRDISGQDDLVQVVSCDFQVPDPRWYVNRYGGTYELGDGSDLGDSGAELGAGGLAQTAPDTGATTYTITNNGNAPTFLVVSIIPRAGADVVTPRVERIVSSEAVEWFEWSGRLTGVTEELFVDGRRQLVMAEGNNGFDDFDYETPEFMTLEPGDNSIKYSFTSQTGTIDIMFYYFDAYIY